MQGNFAKFSFIVDGIDYATEVEPRLMSLSLKEQLEGGADELEITLSNHRDKKGRVLPNIKRGVYATLQLGWHAGPDVKHGMVDKGRFLVDQIVKEGPPDTLKITARSADLTSSMRKRRDKGWKGMTIGAVVAQVAKDNGLESRVHADLAGITIQSVEQAAKSDIAFVHDLGRRYDAIATVKDRKLLFMPIGVETNAGGQALGALTLTRRENNRYSFTISDREDYDGAEAQWHDRGAARKRTVKEGKASNPKRIKRNFASEAEARAVTKAEAKRTARGQYTFNYTMALGDPAVEPNRRVTLQGWDSEIDGITWLVKSATHTLDGQGGLATVLDMESVV